MWDRRIHTGDWILIPNALIFAATFRHQSSVASIENPDAGYQPSTRVVDVVVNPDDFTRAEAERRIVPYLIALGRSPACLFTGLKEVEMMAGDHGVSGCVDNCTVQYAIHNACCGIIIEFCCEYLCAYNLAMLYTRVCACARVNE